MAESAFRSLLSLDGTKVHPKRAQEFDSRKIILVKKRDQLLLLLFHPEGGDQLLRTPRNPAP